MNEHEEYHEQAVLEASQRVEELRKELRDGRRTTTGADTDHRVTYADATSDVTAPGSRAETTRRAPGTDSGAPGQANSSLRSTHKEPVGIGQDARRPGDDHSSSNAKEQGRRRNADNLVPPATFARGRQRKKELKPEKEKSEETGLPWFKQQKALSEEEAASLLDPLKAVLESNFQYADEYLWYKTNDQDQIPVWSNADDEELTAVARAWLKRAQRSPAAAMMVRAVIAGDDYITALIFSVPRTIEYLDRLRHAPKSAEHKEKRRLRYAHKA